MTDLSPDLELKKPSHEDGRTTVVIMTRNRRRSLARTLTRLAALRERPPVIVVDNCSSDGTASFVAARFPSVRLIALAENAGPVARTIGVEAAQTSYVAFADDDSWWQPGALEHAADLLDRHPDLGVIAARTVVGRHRHEDPINAAMRGSALGRDSRLPGPSVLGFLACSCVVRRSAFLSVGGFRESAMGLEESLLAVALVRRGWAVVYVDELVAEHHPAPRPDTADRRRSHARNSVIFAWLHRPPGTAVARTLTTLRRGLHDHAALLGFVDAVRQTPRLLRERDVVDDALEAALRKINL